MRSRALLAAVALLLAPRAALAADPVPSLDLRGFRAPVDPSSGVFVQPADAPDTGEWNVGVWLSYAHRPITLRSAKTGEVAHSVISHQVTSDLVASVGLWHRLQLGLDLPVLLYQTGDAPGAAARRAIGEYVVPAQAFGDLGLYAKLTIVRPTAGELGGFALALDERLTFPTGDTSSFLGEGAISNTARLLAEYRLMVFGVHGALGFKVRGHQQDFGCGAVGLGDCTSRLGHELPFGLGLSFRPELLGIDPKGRMTWFLEMNGHLPVSPMAPFTSSPAALVQLDAAARIAVGADVSVLAGVQTALQNGLGGAPVRALVSVSWAPRSHDQDGDKILDEVDQCPDLAEDRDGFQDEDGCPDLDNDGDEIPDAQDKCPTVAEDKDGFEDADGCPEKDNDQDRIPDVEDGCPNEAGTPNPDAKKNGCPVHDKDGDGIADEDDACPDQRGPAHPDPRVTGCAPTADRDGDGIVDVEDACPTVKGVRAFEPRDNGCPDPDPDHDTLVGAEDQCPNHAETWNGVDDGDGCPEPAARKGRPLLVLREKKSAPARVELSAAIRFTAAGEVDPASLPLLRALASALLTHPEWKAQVGFRKGPKEEASAAEARASAVVMALRKLARRATAGEVAGWEVVKGAPRAGEVGVGVVLVGAVEKAAPKKK